MNTYQQNFKSLLSLLEASSQIPAAALAEDKKYKGKKTITENRWGTADLWAGYFVARRSQPHYGDAPSSRMGFPSPPQVSGPILDDRFAIRGVSSPNLWPRLPRLFMRWLLVIVMALIFKPLATTAASVVYDTTPYWHPTDGILTGLGPGSSSTFGETFVAPMGASVSLNDFTLNAESYGSIANLQLKPFVFEWSGSMTGQGGGAVGYPIYLGSTIIYSPPLRPNGWTPLTVSFGGSGLKLNSGDHYVVGFTLSDLTDYAASHGYVEFQEVPNRSPYYPQLPTGIDGFGGAVWCNNGNNFSALNTTIWDTWGDIGDFAFKAHFTVAPEPTSAMLLVFGGAIWALRRRSSKRTQNP